MCFFKKELYYSNYTLIFTSIAIFSLLITLWANNPILHHFGSPLLGEGSVIFCGLSILSLAIDNISNRNTIYWSVIFSGIVAGIFVFMHHPQHGLNINPNWLPYVFGAFLAPISLCIYAISTKIENHIQQRILLLLSCALLFLSHNKTAWASVFLSSCLWPLVKNRLSLQKYICLSIPFVSALSLFILGKWPVFSSLESRKLALQSYLLSWKDNPLSLITGNGWGSYFENLQKQITCLPVSFFKNHVWQPSWDGIDRLDFHCMHLGAETFFSIGITGLILYLALLATPFLKKYPQKNNLHLFIYTVLFGFLTSTWFTLVCVWPFLIFGFSVFNQHRNITTKMLPPILWSLLCAILCSHAAVTYWQTASLYPTNQKSLFYKFTYSKKIPTSDELKKPYNYRGMHLGHFILTILKKMKHPPSQSSIRELNFAFKIYDSSSSPLILDVALMHGISYFKGSFTEKQNLWDKIAQAIRKKAPKREDLLISYVQFLIENNQLSKAKDIINSVSPENPNNPFVLWMKGMYFIHNDNVEQGKNFMRQALHYNIDTWILIPKSLKNKIEGDTSPSIRKTYS